MTKKDPEGRNVIVLCLLFASYDVLEAIFKCFEGTNDIQGYILKQEYDGNPSLNLAMSLCGFKHFQERSLKVTAFLMGLMNAETMRFCNV